MRAGRGLEIGKEEARRRKEEACNGERGKLVIVCLFE